MSRTIPLTTYVVPILYLKTIVKFLRLENSFVKQNAIRKLVLEIFGEKDLKLRTYCKIRRLSAIETLR